MARTTRILVVAVLAAVAIALSTATPAAAATPIIASHVQQERTETQSYAGTDGRSPQDDVPVAPMVGGIAGLLTVLSVIAWRREWI